MLTVSGLVDCNCSTNANNSLLSVGVGSGAVPGRAFCPGNPNVGFRLVDMVRVFENVGLEFSVVVAL